MKVYVVIIENDRDVYVSDAHTTREAAEGLLAETRTEWAERYGEDGFDEFETDGDIVAVVDGPTAHLQEVEVTTP